MQMKDFIPLTSCSQVIHFAELKVKDVGDLLVLMTLYKGEPQNPAALPALNIYANLSAPILINTRSRIGLQKILVGNESRVNFSTVEDL